jgi:hypothetical protein
MEKPVLMLCKVLKVPPSGEINLTDTPKYRLLPLGEVVIDKFREGLRVSKEAAEAEFLALTEKL